MQSDQYKKPSKDKEVGEGIRTHAKVQLSRQAASLNRQKKAREAKRAKERWLYLDIFNYMEGMELTDDELKMVSYILNQNEIWEEGNLSYYTDIMAEDLGNKFGGAKYGKILGSLENKRYIEINYDYRKNEFSRGYRIHPVFHKAKVVQKRIPKGKKTRFLDKSVIKSPTEQVLHDNKLKLVTVIDPLTIKTTPIRQALGIEAHQKIASRSLNQRQGRQSKRLYDTYITTPKEFRQCWGVKMDDKIYKLVPLDYTTFHPYLVQTEYNRIPDSKVEKEKYLTAIAGDIYTYLKPVGMTRAEAKSQMVRFLAGGSKVSNRISESFRTHFPLLYDHIRKTPRLALKLQNLAASIMVGEIADKCIEQGIWIATEHDGCSTIEPYVDAVRQLMIDTCVKRFGVSCAVKVSINLD